MNGLNKTYKEGKEVVISTEVNNNVILGAIILTAITLFVKNTKC